MGEAALLAFLALVLLLPLALLLYLRFLICLHSVPIPIKNRHVFITGGSSGIGLALAHLCAHQGAHVSLLARNPDKLDEAKQSIKLATGRDVKIYSADVTDYAAVKRAIDDAGPIDVLVCNQGVYLPKALVDQDVDEIKFQIEVNLTGSFHLVKAALPTMKRTRVERGPGCIVLVSSQSGQVGIYGYAAYSAAKYGLKGFAEALQQEVVTDDIHVSLFFPPDTQTPGFDVEMRTRPKLTRILVPQPAKVMTAEEVAKKCLDGIKSCGFSVACESTGNLFCVGMAGLSPQRSCLTAFMEVMTAGYVRVLGLYYQRNWYRTIRKFKNK